MSYEDTYEPDSGLLTDYTGEVTEAWFQPSTFGGLQLCLKQTTDDAAVPEFTENINCGSAWTSYDGGLTAENVTDAEKKRFHKNSRVYEFLSISVKLGAPLPDLGPAQTAQTYVGLRFKWGEVHKDYELTDRETGEKKKGTSTYNMPVEYLGNGNGNGNGASATAPASPAKAAPTESVLGTISPDLTAQLRETRQTAASFNQFVDKAMTLTGVSGNVTLIGAIADPDQLWSELGA